MVQENKTKQDESKSQLLNQVSWEREKIIYIYKFFGKTQKPAQLIHIWNEKQLPLSCFQPVQGSNANKYQGKAVLFKQVICIVSCLNILSLFQIPYVFLRRLDYFANIDSFSNLRGLLFKKLLVSSHRVENRCLGKNWFRENTQ